MATGEGLDAVKRAWLEPYEAPPNFRRPDTADVDGKIARAALARRQLEDKAAAAPRGAPGGLWSYTQMRTAAQKIRDAAGAAAELLAPRELVSKSARFGCWRAAACASALVQPARRRPRRAFTTQLRNARDSKQRAQ